MSHGERSHDESPGRLGPRFQDALVYGAELHRLQLRKGTHIPYVGHLLIVAGTVIEWGGDEDQAIARCCMTRWRIRGTRERPLRRSADASAIGC